MTWKLKDTLERFEDILKQSKEFYKTNAKKLGTGYYTKGDEVSSEELEMACLIIKKLGNVI